MRDEKLQECVYRQTRSVTTNVDLTGKDIRVNEHTDTYSHISQTGDKIQYKILS